MSDGLLAIAEVLLRSSEKRLETVSTNIANAQTPGFKRQAVFQEALSAGDVSRREDQLLSSSTDFSQAALRATGMPFDLAISGDGFFRLRDASGTVYYSRNGRFERTGEGLLRDAHGLVLQTANGGDVVIASPTAEVLMDGVVLEDGLPATRIGVFNSEHADTFRSLGGSLFTAAGDVFGVEGPAMRQGMLEAANVDMATEMVAMMDALRSAEIGARIAQTYDTLIDGSISTFGRG